MSEVSITIDGREIKVPKGSTIYEAAQQIGAYIPTFCYDPELTKVGACRICVVEVEKARALVASCSAPVGDGMVVHTETERVVKARKNILRMILANHPLDCITCQKTGNCTLQDLCYRYGIDSPEMEGETKEFDLDDTNPYIARDMNKCLLCGVCVRTCEEINGVAAIDFMNRGFSSNVGPAFNDPLEDSPCNFCGLCVESCPVGALLPKNSIGKGRPWQLEAKEVICSYCGVGCSLNLQVNNNRVIDVSAVKESPVNRGHLCGKGKFEWEYLHSPMRITSPMIKKEGVFVETTWEEAMQMVASRLSKTAEKYGPDALAGLGSAKVTNEENYLFQKLIRALGTHNVDHRARLYDYKAMAGLKEAFGSNAMTNSLEEITGADTVLVMGPDIAETHRVASYRVQEAKNQGAQLVVISSRETRLALEADVFLQVKPGHEVAVLNGLLHLIIKEDLVDQDFIKQRTEGFEELKSNVESYHPAYVGELTGISEKNLREAARLYAAVEKAAILYDREEESISPEVDQVKLLANLAMATGNVGKASTGVNPLRGENNEQGASDMGVLPYLLPGYQSLYDAGARKKFGGSWKVELNTNPGMNLEEMLQAASEGKLKAMFVMGDNPLLSEPHLDKVEEALEKLDFLVVQDCMLSEMAQYADVVLPAAAFAEQEGTYTNTERRIQLSRPALSPPGEAREGWQILQDLSARLGYQWNYTSAEDIFKEITSFQSDYAGINYDRLKEGYGLQWPCPDENHSGTPFLHQKGFTRGKGKFNAVEHCQTVK